MPRYAELQLSLRPQGQFVEPLYDGLLSEESLVIDDRSCRSTTRVVDDKLSHLTAATTQSVEAPASLGLSLSAVTGMAWT